MGSAHQQVGTSGQLQQAPQLPLLYINRSTGRAGGLRDYHLTSPFTPAGWQGGLLSSSMIV